MATTLGCGTTAAHGAMESFASSARAGGASFPEVILSAAPPLPSEPSTPEQESQNRRETEAIRRRMEEFIEGFADLDDDGTSESSAAERSVAGRVAPPPQGDQRQVPASSKPSPKTKLSNPR